MRLDYERTALDDVSDSSNQISLILRRIYYGLQTGISGHF